MPMTVTWKPNFGPSIVLNDMVYPIDESFEVEVTFSDPSIKKFQRHGEWESFGYTGAAVVTCEGHIIGTSKADYWTKRNAFLIAMTPPDEVQTLRRHGTLTIADSDAAEPMYQYCRITARAANLENLSPEYGPYLAVFKSFSPYFIGLASGQGYLLG